MFIDSKYHPVVSRIINELEKLHYWFDTFEHEPVRTSKEAANIRDGYTLHQGAKALLVRVRISNQEKKFVMLVVPGDMRFNVEKAKQLFHAKDIRFATEQEVSEITHGVLPGGVPPLGHIFGLETYVDPSVLQNEKIIFNAGDRSFSIGMRSEDYRNISQSVVEELV